MQAVHGCAQATRKQVQATVSCPSACASHHCTAAQHPIPGLSAQQPPAPTLVGVAQRAERVLIRVVVANVHRHHVSCRASRWLLGLLSWQLLCARFMSSGHLCLSRCGLTRAQHPSQEMHHASSRQMQSHPHTRRMPPPSPKARHPQRTAQYPGTLVCNPDAAAPHHTLGTEACRAPAPLRPSTPSRWSSAVPLCQLTLGRTSTTLRPRVMRSSGLDATTCDQPAFQAVCIIRYGVCGQAVASCLTAGEHHASLACRQGQMYNCKHITGSWQ